MLSHANRNWFTITCLSYLISNSELCKLFWTCSLFVGVTMISMATEHSVFQTICAITTMAVATQRYVNLKCFCFRKSYDLFLKLIFTVLFKLYIQIKSFIYISTKKISWGWSHDQDQSITILRPSLISWSNKNHQMFLIPFQADCTPLAPGLNNCTCQRGYAGDGVFCIPTIYELVINHPDLTKVAAFLNVSTGLFFLYEQAFLLLLLHIWSFHKINSMFLTVSSFWYFSIKWKLNKIFAIV